MNLYNFSLKFFISKLKQIQSFIEYFFQCFNFNFTSESNANKRIKLIRLHTPYLREILCLDVDFNVVYDFETIEVLRATLCSFYRYRNLWSRWVSAKPHAPSMEVELLHDITGGFYGDIKKTR